MPENDLKNLADRAADAIRLCRLRNVPKFVGFLSPEQAAYLKNAFSAEPVVFFGGAKGCERTLLGALPSYVSQPEQAFPITLLCFEYPAGFSLSHRDVLGTLMAQGIVRAGVGDILFAPGRAYAFVLSELGNYLLQQVQKIGGVGVKPRVANAQELALLQQNAPKKELSFTVASLRLDAVLSGLLNAGRAAAEGLIADGRVCVNSFAVQKATKKVTAGDVITVRGAGKFKIISAGGATRKGRERVLAEKYL